MSETNDAVATDTVLDKLQSLVEPPKRKLTNDVLEKINELIKEDVGCFLRTAHHKIMEGLGLDLVINLDLSFKVQYEADARNSEANQGGPQPDATPDATGSGPQT